MPEPFTVAAIIGAKLCAAHAAHAAGATLAVGAHAAGSHLGSALLVGVIAGTTLAAIGLSLSKLVEGRVMTPDKAKEYMARAKTMPEEKQKDLKRDLEDMEKKYLK